MKRKLVAGMALALLAGPGHGAVTDGVFGPNQIFDVQYGWSGDTLTASNFIAPFDHNGTSVSFGSGQYMAFFQLGADEITLYGLDPTASWYGIALYNADGTLDRVTQRWGSIQALGSDAIFYVGEGFYGNVITTAQGYDYGASAVFPGLTQNPGSAALNGYGGLGPTVLGSGPQQPTPPEAPMPATSLLQALLADAERLQNTMANLTENLASSVDGSINIQLEATDQISAAPGLATVQAGLQADLGRLTATALGSIASGNIESALELSGMSQINAARFGQNGALSLIFAPDLALQQRFNLNSNLAAVNASVNVEMTGMTLTGLASANTTAIGAMGTDAIRSAVLNNAAALRLRLTGCLTSCL